MFYLVALRRGYFGGRASAVLSHGLNIWFDAASSVTIDPKERLDMGTADATLYQGMGLTQQEYIIVASSLDPLKHPS